MTIKTKEAQGTIDIAKEKNIYSMHFKTSKYATFESKMKSMIIGSGWRFPMGSGVHQLGVTVEGNEMFDLAEIKGIAGTTKQLIQFEAILNDNLWYSESIFPLIYEGYPLDGNITIKHRSTADLGLPPTKAMFIRQNPNNVVLTEKDLASNNVNFSTDEAAIVYNLDQVMEKDYREIQAQVVNRYINSGNATPRIKLILAKPYPVIKSGNYGYQIKYVLPGTGKVNYSRTMYINNPIKNIDEF